MGVFAFTKTDMRAFFIVAAYVFLAAATGETAGYSVCPCCGRTLSQGGGGVGSATGGDLTGQPGAPTTPGAPGPGANPGGNSAADRWVNGLGTSSMGRCGEYGRQLVGHITGDNYFFNGIGGAASSADGYLMRSGHFDRVQDTGVYSNGDTRIYQGGKKGYGHWETYYNGGWYSDFQQKGALTGNIGSYYSSAQLYRLK